MTQIMLVWHANGKRQTKVLSDNKPLLIGRHPGCDIVLGDPHVSRRHATIFRKNGGFLIQNLSRTNPIIFNEHWKLPHGLKASLESGDSFEVGHIRMQATVVLAQPAVPEDTCPYCGRVPDKSNNDCSWCGATITDTLPVTVVAMD